ncbi:hypothetical protein RQM59_00695 [Flavobacteriaceae bacterium S356]|uniref:Uncharacterized protein n=1 Tax=Asprobacillus argus TaxID=3076534 RepID=A0ABU3LCF2_9FLAO|nr:hypothetical protein [Flavobacteriaceae bacterium S356]
MHKKLEADLTSLAHSILQMKNKEDVFALKDKAYAVYEKLAVLAYVEEYINNTPNPSKTKEEILEKIENVVEETKNEIVEESIEVVEEVVEDKIDETMDAIKEEPKEKEKEVAEVEDVTDVPLEGSEVLAEKEEEPLVHFLENDLFTDEADKDDVKNVGDKKVLSLDEELQDTIPVDVVADLFENAPKKSLNDKLQGDIQIGLNDRIAFVKNLFDGSQEDFNRVVSQLNTIKTEKEAKKFINKMVKPDYDWTDKEELEERFISIVERKFV